NGKPSVSDDQHVHFHNLDDGILLEAAREVRELTGARKLEAWKPWFPVIDFDRCTNCMQCLTFCLFDVYGVDKQQQITVQNQDNCKTDCPACSRVCPEVAILFPKYGKGPINGDVVREQDVQREAMKVDISTLLGGDLYGSLRNRQREARKRFSTERDESKALLERKRCLGKLKKDLDIPDEVLMTLPTAEDIEERAARAKAKLEKRQARSQTVNDSRPVPSDTEWGI
ncbi:MAG: Fe-S cluster protein, partial [Acidobacteria bacterium]|nr:Fe-S cluster protein [Acidobacteriota bacterium]